MYIKNFIGIVLLFLEIKIPKFLCKGPASNGNGNANGIAMDTPASNGNGIAAGINFYKGRERERDSYGQAFTSPPPCDSSGQSIMTFRVFKVIATARAEMNFLRTITSKPYRKNLKFQIRTLSIIGKNVPNIQS
jgi:hypothetical protein